MQAGRQNVHQRDGRMPWLRPQVRGGCKLLATEATRDQWERSMSNTGRPTTDNNDDVWEVINSNHAYLRS